MRLQIAQPPSDQQYQRNQVLHFPVWSERFQITHLGEPTPAGNHAQTVVVPRTDSLVVRGEAGEQRWQCSHCRELSHNHKEPSSKGQRAVGSSACNEAKAGAAQGKNLQMF